MTRRTRISILSLIVLFMAMVVQFHHHESDDCVNDTLRECHSCQLNPQTFVFTGRTTLSDIAVASSALPPRQDGGDALVPAPCVLSAFTIRGISREISVVSATTSGHILRGPPALA